MYIIRLTLLGSRLLPRYQRKATLWHWSSGACIPDSLGINAFHMDTP